MMAYAVLERGMLSAQVSQGEKLAADDIRVRLPRFHTVNVKKNLQRRSALEAIPREEGHAPQLSIAWPMAQGARAGAFIVPIPGAESRMRLEGNVCAVEIVLTADDLAEIDRIVPARAASAIVSQCWSVGATVKPFGTLVAP
jgi:aryl-alcohol dehydrogenase-like predicted oxidoreductase